MPTGVEGVPGSADSYPVLDRLKATPLSERRKFLAALSDDQRAALLVSLIVEKSYDEARLTPVLKSLSSLQRNSSAAAINNFEGFDVPVRIMLLEKLIAATEPSGTESAPPPIVPTLLHALEGMTPEDRRGLFESLPDDIRRAYLLQDLETQRLEEAGKLVGIEEPEELQRYLDLFSKSEGAGASFRERMHSLHEFLDRLYLISHAALAKRMGVSVESEDFRTLRSHVLRLRNSVRHIRDILEGHPEQHISADSLDSA